MDLLDRSFIQTCPRIPINSLAESSCDMAGTIQLGGKGWRSGFFRKTRRERGAGRLKARNERTTKLLRKKTQPARPIQLNRSGSDGTIPLGGKGWRGGFFRKTRRERGAGRLKARNERTTKLLRKKAQPARPIQLNRSGLNQSAVLHGKHPIHPRCQFFRMGGHDEGDAVFAVELNQQAADLRR